MSDHETTLRELAGYLLRTSDLYPRGSVMGRKQEAQIAACEAGADALRREKESSLTPCGRVAGNPMKLLRAALVGMVGTDDPRELDAMELAIRQSPQPASDKAVAIDAIDALRVTRDAPTEPTR